MKLNIDVLVLRFIGEIFVGFSLKKKIDRSTTQLLESPNDIISVRVCLFPTRSIFFILLDKIAMSCKLQGVT